MPPSPVVLTEAAEEFKENECHVSNDADGPCKAAARAAIPIRRGRLHAILLPYPPFLPNILKARQPVGASRSCLSGPSMKQEQEPPFNQWASTSSSSWL